MNTQAQTQEPDRVRANTAPEVVQSIDEGLERNIRYYATQPEQVISARIDELDREWDMERLLETNASALALTGVLFGIVSSRKWFLLSSGVLGFLMQHAIKGWCPPVPVFRRMGFRTRGEIDREKFALKALRGDFNNLPKREQPKTGTQVNQVVQALAE
jgi:hypothetical protein